MLLTPADTERRSPDVLSYNATMLEKWWRKYDLKN
jgi:hypothetical protein